MTSLQKELESRLSHRNLTCPVGESGPVFSSSMSLALVSLMQGWLMSLPIQKDKNTLATWMSWVLARLPITMRDRLPCFLLRSIRGLKISTHFYKQDPTTHSKSPNYKSAPSKPAT